MANLNQIGGNFSNRIMNSFVGVLFGLALFLGSFVFLFWNEGRDDISRLAKQAVELRPGVVDASYEGKLVSVTGVVDSQELLTDGLFLKPARFLELQRKTEMYGWIEKQERKSGGSEEQQISYDYYRDWVENPKLAGDFKVSAGHENPSKTIASFSKYAERGTVGAYSFKPEDVSLPPSARVPLGDADIQAGSGIRSNDFMFVRKSEGGTPDAPQVGDIRASFHGLRPGFDGTIFGELKGSEIRAYAGENGERLHRLFAGGRNEAISRMRSEYRASLWIFRVLGFLLMWAGIGLILNPVSAVLGIVPFIGSISRYFLWLVTFGAALVLSVLTITVSLVLHSPLVLGILVIVIVALAALFLRLRK